MTFRDLKLLLQQEQGTPELSKLIERLRNKPFWCGLEESTDKSRLPQKNGSAKHSSSQSDPLGQIEYNNLLTRDCCFNHIIGLPEKQGQPKPLFDYELEIFKTLVSGSSSASSHIKYDDRSGAYAANLSKSGGSSAFSSFQNKHLWIKKATGLGITEFMLRFMVWLCVYDNSYRNTQMVLVTGPSIDIAIGLIKRIKSLFDRHEIYFEFKETYLELNGVHIEAYPSHHLDTFRALENPSLIFLDEADFFPQSQQMDARHVSERYIAKSDPYIIMVSTPNQPGGLFAKIEAEPEETCLYRRLKLDYTVGLGRIYSEDEIEKARRSPSFEREYNLKYLGLLGNSFRPADIMRATSIQYNPDEMNPAFESVMGLDPSWGSSNFAIIITQLVDDKIRVAYSQEFEQPDHGEMITLCLDLMQRYNVVKVYVDGANPSFIRSLKSSLGEETDYLAAIARYKASHVNYELNMKVIPVNFSTEHKQLLAHTKLLLSDGMLAIDKRFTKLIQSLHTANDVENSLQKASMSNSDSLDALRLSLGFYEYE